MPNYFAALPVRVPPELLDAVKAGAPPALRWFHRDDLHFTLAFFGKEEPDRIPAIREVISRIPFRELVVTLGRLRLLPSRRRFTAIAFDLRDGRDEISQLIAAWRNPLLEAAGRPTDDRPAFPHLTIARPARKRPDFRPGEVVRWAHSLAVPQTPVAVGAPALFGWAPDRTVRQFRAIA